MPLDHDTLDAMLRKHEAWVAGNPEGVALQLPTGCVIEGYWFPDLTKVTLRYVTFRNCHFRDVTHSVLERLTLEDCMLHNSTILKCTLYNVALSKCSLPVIENGTVNVVHYDDCTGYAMLKDSTLSGFSIGQSCLSGVGLHNCNLLNGRICRSVVNSFKVSNTDLHRLIIDQSLLRAVEETTLAQVSFTGHGSIGRMLTVIKTDKGTTCHCGCFHGSVEALRKFITKDEPNLKHTRRKALNTALGLLTCN